MVLSFPLSLKYSSISAMLDSITVIGNILTSKTVDSESNSTMAVSHFISQVTKLFIVDKSNDLFLFRVSSDSSFTYW